MDSELEAYYLDLYDKYFRLLDDTYTKCNTNCHRGIGDKKIIHRITAQDAREQQTGLKMIRGTDRSITRHPESIKFMSNKK